MTTIMSPTDCLMFHSLLIIPVVTMMFWFMYKEDLTTCSVSGENEITETLFKVFLLLSLVSIGIYILGIIILCPLQIEDL